MSSLYGKNVKKYKYVKFIPNTLYIYLVKAVDSGLIIPWIYRPLYIYLAEALNGDLIVPWRQLTLQWN